jgi:hypothetical protein
MDSFWNRAVLELRGIRRRFVLLKAHANSERDALLTAIFQGKGRKQLNRAAAEHCRDSSVAVKTPDRRINVLLVSLAFSPQHDAEVLQTANLYKYLKSLLDIGLYVLMSADTTSLFNPAS